MKILIREKKTYMNSYFLFYNIETKYKRIKTIQFC